MIEQSGQFIKELEKRMSNQNKLRKLENKRIELVRKLQLCEHYKEKIVRFVQELNNQYNKGLISYKEYYHKLNRALEQRTPEQWIQNYDSSIWYYKHGLNICEREIKKQENKAKIVPLVTILAVFIILGFGFLFLKPAITGLIVGIGEESYTQDISLIVNESTGYEWQPDHAGILRSVLVDGKILGDGSVRVYLDDKLVLDSSKLEKSGISMITGLAISDLAETNEIAVFNETNEGITKITEETENITLAEISETIENITQEETANITAPEEIEANITIPEEINVSENITMPEENITEIIFTDICIETCSLDLNKTSYDLRFEIENAVLYLDSISYTIKPTEIPEVPKIVENISKAEEITQGQAEINKPVKWTKKITLNETISNLTVKLPKNISNVRVSKIKDKIKEEISSDKLKIREAEQLKPISLITGYAVKRTEEAEEETELVIEDSVKEIEIEYYTEAPEVTEKEINAHRKEIIIYSDVHYTNITAYTTITEAPEASIKLYRTTGGIRELTQIINYTDTNNNSLIDKISWVVPSLSNETYEIEIIILNVQSYPTVGGNWTVRFNTTGRANLTIRVVDGTTWSNVNEDNDLRFLEVRCGSTVQKYEWTNSSLFIQDYECNETGYETSKVLTAGKHSLEFRFGNNVEYAFNWATTNCSYREKLTFDNSASSENLTNFTIMVKLNSSRIDYDKTSATDIRFYDDDDATLLSHHWEIWNESGDSFGWVRVPQIDNTNSDYIYAYYNCTDTAIIDVEGTYDDNFKIVHHLNETTGIHYDSTSNDCDGTPKYGVTQDAAGMIDGADDFDGIDDNVQCCTLSPVPTQYTAEAWIKGDTFTGTGDHSTYGYTIMATSSLYGIWLLARNGEIRFYAFSGSTSTYGQTTTTPLSVDTWHHITVTAIKDGGAAKIYVDGNEELSFTSSTQAWAGYFTIGDLRDNRKITFDGIIDEVRLSNTVRSASWINASYLTMADVFITYEQEESGTIPIVTLESPPENYISAADITFNATVTDDYNLVNCSLWHNSTSIWHLNQTQIIIGTSNVTEFNLTNLENVAFVWNIQCFDNESQAGWGSENRTVIVDVSPPSVTINLPKGTLADPTPTLNVTVSDTIGVINTLWYNINNGTNVTICNDCSGEQIKFLHEAEGSYVVYVYANDSLGHLNNTESSTFTIDMNENYYDSYDDNSSITIYNDVSWQSGSLSLTGSGDWWNNGWEYREQIDIKYYGSSVLSNFPAYIRIDKETQMQDDYDDLRFVSVACDQTGGELMDYEIEYYNLTEVDVWIKIPTLSIGTNSICLYYNNSQASSGENATGVWDEGYLGVWHMINSSGYVNDSSMYEKDGTNDGAVQTNNTPAGPGLTFAEVNDDNIALGAFDEYEGEINVTFEAYFKLDVLSDDNMIFAKSDTYAPLMWGDTAASPANRVNTFAMAVSGDGGADNRMIGQDNALNDITNWHHLLIVFDGTNQKFWAYLDGVEDPYSGSTHTYSTFPTSTADLYIGTWSGNPTYAFDGTITEARISDVSRSLDYANQTYQMITNQDSLVTIGNKEDYTGSSGNFTSTEINTTQNITSISNITWTEDNTDSNNNITVEISVDNEQNWYAATNSSGISGFAQDNSLVYRVMFATNETKTISLLDMNITWSEQAVENQPPVITDISDIPEQSITEAGISYANFSVLASDANGVNNLDDTSLNATFSK
ncbi:hypothetical protein COV14_02155, partial [Candidatus Woesearchaeota archaeon CG10_big_fil_rev_8_21_14_0_10_33_12]